MAHDTLHPDPTPSPSPSPSALGSHSSPSPYMDLSMHMQMGTVGMSRLYMQLVCAPASGILIVIGVAIFTHFMHSVSLTSVAVIVSCLVGLQIIWGLLKLWTYLRDQKLLRGYANQVKFQRTANSFFDGRQAGAVRSVSK